MNLRIYILFCAVLWCGAVVLAQVPLTEREDMYLFPPPPAPEQPAEISCKIVPPSRFLRDSNGNLRPRVMQRMCRGADATFRAFIYDGPEGEMGFDCRPIRGA